MQHGNKHHGMGTSDQTTKDRKLRIESLFLDQLSSREYIRLQSGKWKCQICPNHPILDTIEIVKIHCLGKKHQNYSNRYHFASSQPSLSAIPLPKKSNQTSVNLIESTCQKVNHILNREHQQQFEQKNPNDRNRYNYDEQKKTIASNRYNYDEQKIPNDRNRYNYDQQKTPNAGNIHNNEKEFFGNSSGCKKKRQWEESNSFITEDKCRRLYLAGYIKNDQGNWVRDSVAEFDSDEEDIII